MGGVGRWARDEWSQPALEKKKQRGESPWTRRSGMTWRALGARAGWREVVVLCAKFSQQFDNSPLTHWPHRSRRCPMLPRWTPVRRTQGSTRTCRSGLGSADAASAVGLIVQAGKSSTHSPNWRCTVYVSLRAAVMVPVSERSQNTFLAFGREAPTETTTYKKAEAEHLSDGT